jgi:Putative F0F1-ATPase subunit Ca2+/Mg2+ transporter
VDLFRDNMLRHRRELNRGFGDAFTASVELALTPALFGGIGFAIDRWLGIFPLFTLVLGLFSLVGMFVRAWYDYDARMRQEEQLLLGNPSAAAAPIAPTVPSPEDAPGA